MDSNAEGGASMPMEPVVKTAQSLDDVYDAVRSVAPRYGISAVGAFGSFARGEQGAASDVDLAVQFPSEASLMDIEGFRVEMERLLGRSVDLVTSLEGATPTLRAALERDLVKLYEA